LTGSGFYVQNSQSQHALCGSGLGLTGNFTVTNNYIAYNGRDKYAGGSGEHWSDGITIIRCDSGTISGNTLVDNTDIGIVYGGGSNCSIQNNTIWNGGKYAFAGLHDFRFPQNSSDSPGTVISGNQITSLYNMMSIGLLVGSHPWTTDPSQAIGYAGQVVNNTISGAVIDLVVEGIGDGYVAGNSVSGSQGDNGLNANCYGYDYTAWHAGNANIQPGSFGLQYDDATSGYACIPEQ
jgi:parallel beta-helix repeat protein